MGYVRKLDDHSSRNGAEYTLTHVSRGSHFLKDYLPRIGLPEMADIAAELIHFTGYETPVSKIKVPSPMYKLLGSMLGSADIIAQMSDRCYLEKCRDRLYPEFLAGGIARKPRAKGEDKVIFKSGDDLVMKTPGFFKGAMRRLDDDLWQGYRYAEVHFGGQNIYLEEMDKNARFAKTIKKVDDVAALKRTPPETLILA